jgi:hypothetical protein
MEIVDPTVCRSMPGTSLVTRSAIDCIPAILKANNPMNQVTWTAAAQTCIPSGPDTDINRFVLAAHSAYDMHQPFIISPDAIWVLLLQAFTEWIRREPAQFKVALVGNTTPPPCVIVRDDFLLNSATNNWPSLIPEINSYLLEILGLDNYNMLAAPLSTNVGTLYGAAPTVVLGGMATTVETWTDYQLVTNCAISKYIIQGAADDWEKIRYRLNFIANSYAGALPTLRLWTTCAGGVIDKILSAIGGEKDIEFWRMFYVHKPNTKIHGWINVFFPYVGAKLNGIALDWKSSIGMASVGTPIGAFPRGYGIIDVDWQYKGTIVPIEFITGFMAIAREGAALRPEMGWIIRKKIA